MTTGVKYLKTETVQEVKRDSRRDHLVPVPRTKIRERASVSDSERRAAKMISHSFNRFLATLRIILLVEVSRNEQRIHPAGTQNRSVFRHTHRARAGLTRRSPIREPPCRSRPEQQRSEPRASARNLQSTARDTRRTGLGRTRETEEASEERG